MSTQPQATCPPSLNLPPEVALDVTSWPVWNRAMRGGMRSNGKLLRWVSPLLVGGAATSVGGAPIPVDDELCISLT